MNWGISTKSVIHFVFLVELSAWKISNKINFKKKVESHITQKWKISCFFLYVIVFLFFSFFSSNLISPLFKVLSCLELNGTQAICRAKSIVNFIVLLINTLLFVCLISVPRKLKTLLTYMHCLLHPFKFHVLRPKRDKSILQKKLQLNQIDLGGWFLPISDMKLC